MDKPPVLLLVDGHALVHRAYHAVPAGFMTSKGEPTNAVFGFTSILLKALEETRAKFISRDELVTQLVRLRDVWPDLRRRLTEQLVPSQQMATMLRDAGAPSRCEEIGISAERLRRSHRQAMHIRRRFTVLDLADRLGLLDA